MFVGFSFLIIEDENILNYLFIYIFFQITKSVWYEKKNKSKQKKRHESTNIISIKKENESV